MNREYKFRAWDKTLRKWENVWNVISFNGRTMQWNPVRYEIAQYTGLHDKNGKEVYEGDLVRAYAKTDWGSRTWQLAEVEWGATHGQWYFTIHEYESGEHKGSESWGAVKFLIDTPSGLQPDIEIIGNIYEKPKLLPTQ